MLLKSDCVVPLYKKILTSAIETCNSSAVAWTVWKQPNWNLKHTTLKIQLKFSSKNAPPAQKKGKKTKQNPPKKEKKMFCFFFKIKK